MYFDDVPLPVDFPITGDVTQSSNGPAVVRAIDAIRARAAHSPLAPRPMQRALFFFLKHHGAMQENGIATARGLF